MWWIQEASKFSFYYFSATAGIPQSDGRRCALFAADLLLARLSLVLSWDKTGSAFLPWTTKVGSTWPGNPEYFQPWRSCLGKAALAPCCHQPSASCHQQAGFQRLLAHLLYLTCLCPCPFVFWILPGKVNKVLFLVGELFLLQFFRLCNPRGGIHLSKNFQHRHGQTEFPAMKNTGKLFDAFTVFGVISQNGVFINKIT